MNIEQINDSKIKVTVDAHDQRKYGITYETMNYDDTNTKKLCESIIEKAGKQIGFDFKNSRILFEAKSDKKGTITIFISKIPKSLRGNTEYMYQIIEYKSIDDFLDSREILVKYLDIIVNASIYKVDTSYYLYLETEGSVSESRAMISHLLEYGEISDVSKEYISEHCSRKFDTDIIADILHY